MSQSKSSKGIKNKDGQEQRERPKIQKLADCDLHLAPFLLSDEYFLIARDGTQARTEKDVENITKLEDLKKLDKEHKNK